MLFPIPMYFYSCFDKKSSLTHNRSDDSSSITGDENEFDDTAEINSAIMDMVNRKCLENGIDSASVTQEETDASSACWLWQQPKSPRRLAAIKQAEDYKDYLDSSSIAESLRLIPFVSIDLHLDSTEHSEETPFADDYDYEGDEEWKSLNEEESKQHADLWWGMNSLTDGLIVPPVLTGIELPSDLEADDELLSHSAEHNEIICHADEINDDGSCDDLAMAVPSEIFCPKQQSSLVSDEELWIYDPVDPLIQGKLPFLDDNDPLQHAVNELQACFETRLASECCDSHSKSEFDEAVEEACLILEHHPQAAQVRYHLDAPSKSFRALHSCFSGSIHNSHHHHHHRLDSSSCSPCLPLTIFSAVGSVQGVMAAYKAYPEAVGHVDNWLGLPLHYACYNGQHESIVYFLLEKYPEAARVTNDYYQSPLHLACCLGNHRNNLSLRVIRLLLKYYPTAAQLADEEGYTPLHLACQSGASVEIMEALTQGSSAVASAATRSLEKPLHLAARNCASTDAVRFLLRLDPSQASAVDKNHQTPLHKACMAPTVSLQLVELLLEAYPDAIHVHDIREERPYDVAQRNGSASPIVLQLLQDAALP